MLSDFTLSLANEQVTRLYEPIAAVVLEAREVESLAVFGFALLQI